MREMKKSLGTRMGLFCLFVSALYILFRHEFDIFSLKSGF